jgi:predicted metal-binding protein
MAIAMPASANADDYSQILKMVRMMGASDAKIIRSSQVVVRDWVRMKCRFGCDGYGKILTCPPFSPTPDEFRRVLAEYRWAALLKFEVSSSKKLGQTLSYERNIHDLVVKMEREAFLNGYYAAFGLAAGPCPHCKECDLKECKHPFAARPSMEGCGVDVFATVRNAGFEIRVVKDKNEKPTFYALLLLE